MFSSPLKLKRYKFDTVDRSILLSKLNYYRIRGIANDWFKSYQSSQS